MSYTGPVSTASRTERMSTRATEGPLRLVIHIERARHPGSPFNSGISHDALAAADMVIGPGNTVYKHRYLFSGYTLSADELDWVKAAAEEFRIIRQGPLDLDQSSPTE